MLILQAVRCPVQAASSLEISPACRRRVITETTLAIDWSELDLFGHVNNVMFFKYLQAARLKFCEQLGLTSLNEPGRLSFVVASSSCSFRSPLYYPGEVIVRTSAAWARNTSFCLRHEIRDSKDKIAGEGEDVLVLFDYSGHKKVVLDPSLKARMGF